METLLLRRNITSFHNVLNYWCNNRFKISSRDASNTIPLVYKVHGKNITEGSDPILILHGFLGSKQSWNTMATKIQQLTKKSVITVDQRNHGESGHTASHTYYDLAEDLSELLRELHVERANLIGHSMGGRAAMALALTHATQVSSLTVIDISPLSFPIRGNNFFAHLMNVVNEVKLQTKHLTVAKRMVRQAIKQSGLLADETTTGYLLTNLDKGGEIVRWKCNIKGLRDNWENIATFPVQLSQNTYSGPTLFVAGKKSKFIPESEVKGIKNIFPLAKVEYVDGAGHNVHVDKPEILTHLITTFIKKIK